MSVLVMHTSWTELNQSADLWSSFGDMTYAVWVCDTMTNADNVARAGGRECLCGRAIAFRE